MLLILRAGVPREREELEYDHQVQVRHPQGAGVRQAQQK